MKKIKIILGTTILTASIALTGCISNGNELKEVNSPLKMIKECGSIESKTNSFNIYEVQDKNTGTRYYLLEGYRSIALTPIIENNSVEPAKKDKEKDKKLDNINKQIKELEKQKQDIENKEN